MTGRSLVARGLLGLLGDAGAELSDVQAIELQELKRTVDGVVKLRCRAVVYYRHPDSRARRTRIESRSASAPT